MISSFGRGFDSLQLHTILKAAVFSAAFLLIPAFAIFVSVTISVPLFIALIIFFGLGYKIPAVIVGLIIAIQPLMIILVSNMIARKI